MTTYSCFWCKAPVVPTTGDDVHAACSFLACESCGELVVVCRECGGHSGALQARAKHQDPWLFESIKMHQKSGCIPHDLDARRMRLWRGGQVPCGYAYPLWRNGRVADTVQAANLRVENSRLLRDRNVLIKTLALRLAAEMKARQPDEE